jgi:dTDP-4-amino-4,6-dideoxygalactose transaminase
MTSHSSLKVERSELSVKSSPSDVGCSGTASHPADAGLKDLDYSILQQCMHCGMCLPTCPTYDATKMERNSPRGRISLMRDWGAEEKYNHIQWGGNFRLEPLQASFLRIKLRELKNWTKERQQIAKIYQEKLNPDFLMKEIAKGGSHVYHVYSIQTPLREEICAFLSSHLIGYGFHYPKAIHQQPAYVNRVLTPVPLTNCEWLAKSTLSIPIFPGQSPWEINRVIEVVNSAKQSVG